MESLESGAPIGDSVEAWLAKERSELLAARESARTAFSELVTEISELGQVVEETVQKELEEVKEKLTPENLLRAAPLAGVALALMGGIAAGILLTGQREEEADSENAGASSAKGGDPLAALKESARSHFASGIQTSLVAQISSELSKIFFSEKGEKTAAKK